MPQVKRHKRRLKSGGYKYVTSHHRSKPSKRKKK